ncbi:MAG: divalent-cation tolerance protein CutA [Methanosarcina sp.]|uniref:divalent-cation tolerance protein CutA n=1 Tax=Methanosarcina sp. TaxID=2213 RepID=UPI003BB5B9F7
MLGIVYITAESMDNASKIARELVSKRLAACVNMFPVSSVYRWNEKIEEDNEIAMLVKTDFSRFEEITRLVKSLHTYEMPAIEFWEIEGDREYLNWIHLNSSGKYLIKPEDTKNLEIPKTRDSI